jgi:beta-galactosidase/beta-glucuronidase
MFHSVKKRLSLSLLKKLRTDMNSKILWWTILVVLVLPVTAKEKWNPVGDKIKTAWSSQVDSTTPWPEYPRPTLVRQQWLNLNGLWDYAITSMDEAQSFQKSEGQILVPFAVESSLSGVQRSVNSDETLWYRTNFKIPADWCNQHNRIILHFDAVDWRADVYVNGVFVGCHTGGYTPFHLDVTSALRHGGKQQLVVKVTDTTDEGYQPRGKQIRDPHGIWYTSVTGIWQTVWLEPVPMENHIERVNCLCDFTAKAWNVQVATSDHATEDYLVVEALDKEGHVVAQGKDVISKGVRLVPSVVRPWSPDDPYLYDIRVTLMRGNRVLDEVTSYAALREIGTMKDRLGHWRMTLNGKPLFHYGLLDQGWWPDGLYTAPTDEALLSDIQLTKALGYNMIRKHVKVEPERWYYHCDREGILVWQDMPSGDMSTGTWERHNYNGGEDATRTAMSKANYYKEWGEVMDFCGVHPCVVVWVPFNEAWGQFQTESVALWTKHRDPSRLVNSASGGNFRVCGDILDLHNYPAPKMFLYDANRVNVLGEYGGIGLPLEGHLWSTEKNWGYVKLKNAKDVTDRYVDYATQLLGLIEQGFSGAVYTQTTDVEGEINGLVTYDRSELKVDKERVREINQRIVHALDE